jgi:aspartyl/asparaginyl beta-hydroxylase (cupin superfamily)
MIKINTFKYIFFKKICKFLIFNAEKIFKKYKIQDLPDFDKDFKKGFIFIKNEVLAYLKNNELPNASDISVEQQSIENEKKWKVLVLKVFSKYNQKNCNLLPKTTKILKKHKNIVNAMFSKMEPNSHIKRHRGVYNGLVRYHFGIKIPNDKNNLFIIINDEKIHWKENESFIFDDTQYHEAVNNTKEDRLILMIDYERPIPWFLKPLNKIILYIIEKSPLIKNSIENLDNFNK